MATTRRARRKSSRMRQESNDEAEDGGGARTKIKISEKINRRTRAAEHSSKRTGPQAKGRAIAGRQLTQITGRTTFPFEILRH